MEKHCTLCQKHGGASGTHNTNECTKYEKDGTMKSSWGTGKSPNKSFNKKGEGKAFAQLAKTVSKLEKAIKKGRASSKKKKLHYDSDSSTDSE